MTEWTSDELDTIGNAGELRLTTQRPDGTLRNPVTIWVIRRRHACISCGRARIRRFVDTSQVYGRLHRPDHEADLSAHVVRVSTWSSARPNCSGRAANPP